MKRIIITLLAAFSVASPLLAQSFQVDARIENAATQGSLSTPTGPSATGVQFGGLGASNASSNAISTDSELTTRYPSNTAKTLVFQHSFIGSAFASGVPRYNIGDQILPPLVQEDGITPAPEGYWRKKPLTAGETIAGDLSALIPDGTVEVLTSNTNTSTVTVVFVPPSLKVGYSILGQPISDIDSNTITLAGNANQTITTSSVQTYIPSTSYYYSPHAEKVFAAQAGSVNVTWVTEQPTTAEPIAYSFLGESFGVSANASQTPRTIYWTQNGFDGPSVVVSDGRVISVNPIYTPNVPKAVKTEVLLPGASSDISNLKTLYFDKQAGSASLKAYNVEGRIMIEYLGDIRAGSDIHHHLGIDVVDIKRLPEVRYAETYLGQEILSGEGDAELVASSLNSTSQNSRSYYGTSVNSDNSLSYFAEVSTSPENQPDNGLPAGLNAYNKVAFYWLAQGQFGTQWPSFQTRYWLRWSPNLSDYEFNTVDSAGSTPEDGIAFTGGQLPNLVFQDDPSETEAQIDLNTQRLFVNFRSGNQRNRSLLKFSNGAGTWYVNLYSQAEDRAYTAPLAKTARKTIVEVSDTSSSQIGDLVWVQGNEKNHVAYILAIIDKTHVQVSLSEEGEELPSEYIALHTWRNDVRVLTLSRAETNISHQGNFQQFDVGSTLGLEVGMYVTDLTNEETHRIVRILDDSVIEIDQALAIGTYSFTFTTEPNAQAPLVATATVGTRISPPAGHELAGHISSGDLYSTSAYIDPIAQGIEAANSGAIIPVNAVPGKDKLTVRWFKKVAAKADGFQSFYIPGKVGHYTIEYPSAAPVITIAEGIGTGDLSIDKIDPEIYYQNDPAQVGYNPNEEHSLYLGGRGYALREDLNVITGADYTSEPYLLLAYTDADDQRPNMAAYRVQRTSASHTFEYEATAGTLLNLPYPLPLMPLPMPANTEGKLVSLNFESGVEAPENSNLTENQSYKHFTFNDRKGYTWVHRGTHEDLGDLAFHSATYGTASNFVYVNEKISAQFGKSTPIVVGTDTMGSDPNAGTVDILRVNYWSDIQQRLVFDYFSDGDDLVLRNLEKRLTMRLYYPTQDGFFIPGHTSQPALGTAVPFLRELSLSGSTLDLGQIDKDETHEPLAISYRPKWPDNVPKLRMGETLTLPKFGLPQVRGQKSAHVLYQQSLANGSDSTGSVLLHDPTREKVYTFGDDLDKLPKTLKITSYQGKIFFQRAPAHLQQRFYFDPLRGAKGELVLLGEFHDVPAGEDYLDLNVLSAKDVKKLKDLIPDDDTNEDKWDTAIDHLSTVVETFREHASQNGTFEPDSSLNDTLTVTQAAYITNSDTAVDSYAVTATGKGIGYVTMVFGNGKATNLTPEGDPVQVKIFEVEQRLYTGDLKVIQSSNPLDEQVSLRHSGDFAAKVEDYDFEWRWSPGAATAPLTYINAMDEKIGSSVLWRIIDGPGAALPTSAQYASASAQSIGSAITVYPTGYDAAQQSAGYPSIVLKSENNLDFSAGVPNSVVFSAELGDFDGFALYINGVNALAHNAPAAFFESTGAASGIVDGALSKQFNVPASFFTQGENKVEVAIFTTADAAAQSVLSFRVDAASRQEDPNFNTTWLTASDPNGLNSNIALVGGDPSIPFGASHFVLNDRWFTLRYRPTVAGHLLQNQWSDWTSPMFVEGWIKRVLAAINPSQQRMTNLYENAIDSDVSVVTQAGTRWEGDIALNLDNINDTGLIEIYETVLNRARSMSIDANVNDPDTNNALLLAAGYLNDLYNILGNEAYADAANPTISIDDQSGATEVNTSRFSFESQVASSLDEELALLRGRDDLVSPGARTAPAYNRLYWNYTRGINSGEVLYAVNYNIREKAGSDTANGIIDEEDAQRMFPQGHGDAYGHYLTALKGYYRLLSSPNFDWIPRAEAVTVLGQPVTIDYHDERKFASSAANLARASEQILNLTYRKNYQDDPGRGWSHLRDDRGNNPSSGITPKQGLEEWTSRATQGTYYHWALANSLVPAVDNVNQGIQKIDRTTVPELGLLVASVTGFQTLIDNANAHLNPLGLSPGAVAFDISPTELENGESHFEQIYTRAKLAMNNAAGAFNRAAVMSRSLRSQETQLNDYDAQLAQQELAYTKQLIEIYGRPYNGHVGAGQLYAQGHTGPDLLRWFIVDQPNDLANPAEEFTIEINVAKDEITSDGPDPIANIQSRINAATPADDAILYDKKTVTVQPGQFVQYNKIWESNLGSRPETGELQQVLYEAHRNFLILTEIGETYGDEEELLQYSAASFRELLASHKARLSASSTAHAEIVRIDKVIAGLEVTQANADFVADLSLVISDTVAEYLPTNVGLSVDATSPARGAVKTVGAIVYGISKIISLTYESDARSEEGKSLQKELDLDQALTDLEFSLEARQAAYELQAQWLELSGTTRDLYTYSLDYQRSLEKVRSTLAKGLRVQEERELFRQRAAAIIQGYRTSDLSFRLFRDESLEQYRTLYDLAARYCYLAAKSYDYETGLLGSDEGQEVFSQLVSSRALGDIQDGEPQATTSTLADAGLAGTMARLAADFSVAEGRLGINNPDQYGTVFSLRKELFRIMDDPAITIDDETWRQTLQLHMVYDLMADEDIANQCLGIASADGGAVPGIVISFSTTIEQGKNFFGLPLAGGDHAYSASSFATKIHSIGVSLPGYVGMDPYASGSVNAGAPAGSSENALSATPYLYVIPCGVDYMLAPPIGEVNTLRSWKVDDQALPLPFNLGASDFNSGQFFNTNGSLSEQPWVNRKHQAFRAVADASFFYSRVPAEFTNSRLVGRSAWNSKWKIVIPAYTLLNNEQNGLDNFANTVKDIQLFLRTYSHSGN